MLPAVSPGSSVCGLVRVGSMCGVVGGCRCGRRGRWRRGGRARGRSRGRAVDLPSSVGLDAVVQADHGSVVPDPGLSEPRLILCVQAMVWSICIAGWCWRRGEGVGRGEQVHGLSVPLGDLVGIDRVWSRGRGPGDLEPAPVPEVAAYPVGGDRVGALDPGDELLGEVGEEPHGGQQLGVVEEVGCLGGVEPFRRQRWRIRGRRLLV